MAGDLENFVGLNGFEKRDPARVVIAFGRAQVSATRSKGTVEVVVISDEDLDTLENVYY